MLADVKREAELEVAERTRDTIDPVGQWQRPGQKKIGSLRFDDGNINENATNH